MLRLSCTNQNYDDNKETIELFKMAFNTFNRLNRLFNQHKFNIVITRGYSNTEIIIDSNKT